MADAEDLERELIVIKELLQRILEELRTQTGMLHDVQRRS